MTASTGATSGPRAVSVVIAAHDEEGVLGPCLDALTAQVDASSVVVVANGCSDATAALARGRGVRVLELDQPGKANALNVGERVLAGFPRLYLDADIVLPPDGVRRLVEALGSDPDLEAVVPARRLDVRGRPWPVRCWAAVNQRLPVYERSLFGRGTIMLSEVGRGRFDEFPGLQADDLYLDGVVALDRRRSVPAVEVVIETPRSTKELVNRLVRVRRANGRMRAVGSGARPAARAAWFRSVVLPRPWLLPAGCVYAALTLVAAARARLDAGSTDWGRDSSTRTRVGRPGSLR